jgi:2-oxoglutarate dehydrogenase E2 component (dihydrolipoamide succinyltransferase)
MADVTLPQLGETVTEGTITQWFKQVGDSVAEDEPLFEVSTDKVDTEVPSPAAGTVTEIRAQEGDTVAVGTVIAVIGDGAAAPPAQEAAPGAEPEPEQEAEPEPEPEPEQKAEPEPERAAEPEPAPPAEPEPAPAAETKAEPAPEPEPAPAAPAEEAAPTARLLSPVVRRLVNEHGLDPASITGTGPGGRITRDDVLDHIDRVGAQPAPEAKEAPAAPAPEAKEAPAAPAPEAKEAPAAPAAKEAPAAAPTPAATPAAAAPEVVSGERDTSISLSRIRKLTGSHMVMSKGVSPHAYSVVEVDYANVDRARGAVKADWKQSEGFSLTYLPFISRAVIDALAEFPHLNASVGAEDLVVHRYVDLGIAVDLDYEGLIAPVIRDADTKRLRAIAREIHDLAARARTRKLMPDEISGGTFTITNNGSAGSVLTLPIINQPQVAILSTDLIVRKPVVAELPGGGEAIVIHPVGRLAMAWDHRAFDGAYAAGFLKRTKELLETRDWSAEL